MNIQISLLFMRYYNKTSTILRMADCLSIRISIPVSCRAFMKIHVQTMPI
jgi:hypothetical protein